MTVDDLLEEAWGIICNASQGDWFKEGSDWVSAAVRWREKYFMYLDEQRGIIDCLECGFVHGKEVAHGH